MDSPVFQALARELSLADKTICSGLTAIRDADLSINGTYSEAFFNLSIGMERMGKLIFILDHCFSNKGKFPEFKKVKDFGHNLIEIMGNTKTIRAKYPIKDELGVWLDSNIANGIVNCLSQFALDTRYYNLNYITGAAKTSVDPSKLWYDSVINPILIKHYSKKSEGRDRQKFQALGNFGWDAVVMTRFTAEDGRPINTFNDINWHAHKTRIGNKWAQLYLLRIVRFLAILLMDLSWKAYELRYDFIPDIGDFFGKFRNDDSYFKTRKSWRTA